GVTEAYMEEASVVQHMVGVSNGENVVFFFFQAEDGIRDRNVTGVQTCALPISNRRLATCCRSRKSDAELPLPRYRRASASIEKQLARRKSAAALRQPPDSSKQSKSSDASKAIKRFCC